MRRVGVVGRCLLIAAAERRGVFTTLTQAAGCPVARVGSLVSARRFAAHSAAPSDGGAAPPAFPERTYANQEETSQVPSTVLRDEAFEGEEFDELEAASQEVHDLCFAMIAYLRRADPDGTPQLFHGRTKRSFREPKPERQRRLLHGHQDRTIERKNLFASEKDFEHATQLFLQWGEKLMLLLTKPVLDRLIESAGKSYRDNRSDGIHRFKRPIERASWRTFPHRWYKHAPFEVQQLRADIPESAVLNTRFYRDHCTLRYMFSLMEPQHAYRAALEKRLFELTGGYDPRGQQNTSSPKHQQ